MLPAWSHNAVVPPARLILVADLPLPCRAFCPFSLSVPISFVFLKVDTTARSYNETSQCRYWRWSWHGYQAATDLRLLFFASVCVVSRMSLVVLYFPLGLFPYHPCSLGGYFCRVECRGRAVSWVIIIPASPRIIIIMRAFRCLDRAKTRRTRKNCPLIRLGAQPKHGMMRFKPMLNHLYQNI